MESDIDSTSNDEHDLALSWSGRWSLAHRILAVNILTLLLVALSTLYLDIFRNRLSKERVRQTRLETTAAATSGEAELPRLERGRLVMDPARHKVLWDGMDVSLTVTEFLILEALAQRPGVVKSRNQLLDVAYSDDVYVDDRTIDSHIKRIRRKFRGADTSFDAIETLYGVGYKFGEE